jgi:hypothetical protein
MYYIKRWAYKHLNMHFAVDAYSQGYSDLADHLMIEDLYSIMTKSVIPFFWRV